MSSEEDYFDELEYDLADEVNEEKEDIQTKKLTTVNCQTEKFNPFEILPESIELFRTLALISPDRLSLSETAQILPKIVDLKRILQQQEIDFIKLLPFFNEIIPLIKSNIKLMHNFLISLYSRRFPELSSLIPSPLQYSKVISILENENYSKNESDELFFHLENKAKLTREQILVLTMSMKTSFKNKEPLDIKTRTQILEANSILENLWKLQEDIGQYIASKISIIAPNVCFLVGPEIAAQLIAHAGGVLEFSRIPSCNIASIGKNKHLSHELHTLESGVRQEGYLFASDMIQKFPVSVHKQMLRMLCAKVSLAARVDAGQKNGDRNTILAHKWKAELSKKARKLSEAPSISETKALPIPEDQPKKKRAGRKFRKYKEKFRLSHVRQLQNRMEFGKQEQTVLDSYGEEVGLGMSNTSLQQAVGATSGSRRSAGNQAKLTKVMKHRISEANQQADEFLISLGHNTEQPNLSPEMVQMHKKQHTNPEEETNWFSGHG